MVNIILFILLSIHWVMSAPKQFSYRNRTLPHDPTRFESIRAKIGILERNQQGWSRADNLAQFKNDYPNPWWYGNNYSHFVKSTVEKGWPPMPTKADLRKVKGRIITTGFFGKKPMTKVAELIQPFAPTTKLQSCVTFAQKYCRNKGLNWKSLNRNNNASTESEADEDDDMDCDDEYKEKEGSDNGDSDSEEEKEWIQYNLPCNECSVPMSSAYWPVICYGEKNGKKCNYTAHYMCLLMDPSLDGKLYCKECWISSYAKQPPLMIEDENDLHCINILYDSKNDDAVEYYFFLYIVDGTNDIGYFKTEDDKLSKIEEKKKRKWRVYYQNKMRGYEFTELGRNELSIDNNSRNIEWSNYNFGPNYCPVIKLHDFVKAKGALSCAQRIFDVYDDEKFCTKYGDSIQKNSNRGKFHCGHYYGTNTDDKRLVPCSLDWRILFPEGVQQELIRDVCTNSYVALKQAGCQDDIEWLTGKIGEAPMVVLAAIYHGGGLAGHVDRYFEGPVIVVTLWNRPRGDKEPGNTKKISFCIQGRKSINVKAELGNEELSAYIFWNWMTDFGVHGVPTQAQNDSIVLIIRKGRFLKSK